jgi:hypothetical protein
LAPTIAGRAEPRMKITAIEPILLAIPFRHDGPETGFAGQT